LYESAFRFKQGLGRLIRRPGLPGNREIYVLDGRLRDPQFLNMASIFQRMLERYPRIQKCSL
jgi:Rad3-related DNA helicase